MERWFTESQIIAALRQARQDISELREDVTFGATDREKMTAYVALAEAATNLGLAEEYNAPVAYEN